MRLVMFRDNAVKRQQRIGDDKILVVFYSKPSMVVTVKEWESEKTNRYTDGTVPRRQVVKNL
jgi:hypothetical protein